VGNTRTADPQATTPTRQAMAEREGSAERGFVGA
jgi:hypothetical protein